MAKVVVSSSRPNRAVRTSTDTIESKAIVVIVIIIPVRIAINIDVYLGRSPKSDSRFLPTLSPSLSPTNAIVPPVSASTKTRSTPLSDSMPIAPFSLPNVTSMLLSRYFVPMQLKLVVNVLLDLTLRIE